MVSALKVVVVVVTHLLKEKTTFIPSFSKQKQVMQGSIVSPYFVGLKMKDCR
jgi:hypothetical protein